MPFKIIKFKGYGLGYLFYAPIKFIGEHPCTTSPSHQIKSSTNHKSPIGISAIHKNLALAKRQRVSFDIVRKNEGHIDNKYYILAPPFSRVNITAKTAVSQTAFRGKMMKEKTI